MHRLTRHLRVNAVAYLALFVALGGTSYAAIRLPANSVGTKQVTKNAIVSSKVRNGSLLRQDFKAGQLPTGSGAQGAAGPAGATGATGATGSADPSAFYTKSEADGAFLGKTAKAADADTLDGIDAAGLVHGSGSQGQGFQLLQNGDTGIPLITIPGIGSMTASCGTDAVTTLTPSATLKLDEVDFNNATSPQNYSVTAAKSGTGDTVGTCRFQAEMSASG